LDRAAIHEAGHAVVGDKQGLGLVSISIRRIGMSGGRTRFVEPIGSVSTAEEMARHIRMMLGGLVAEQVLCGGASTGSGGGLTSDLAQATILAAAMRGSFGLVGDLSWKASPDRVFDRMHGDPQLAAAVESDLRRYRFEAAGIVRRYRHDVLSLARRLRSEMDVRL
jgi:ATP-dependent Zn protease